MLAAAYDLKVFFTVVSKEPAAVVPADVLAFITAQRTGRSTVQFLAGVDRGAEAGGVAPSTVARRLSTHERTSQQHGPPDGSIGYA